MTTMPEEVLPVLDGHEAKKLVSISPGTKCVLIGIDRLGFRPHSHRRGRHSGSERHYKQNGSDEDYGNRDSHRGKGRGLMRRLLDLGITKGCTFTVIQGGGRGPVLIEVRGTRIALGHHMASRILVKEVP
jgi:Fe2+ transport system protein FeoA